MKSTFKPNTVVVIDAGVENYQQLMDGVLPGAKTFLVEKTGDGIEQIDQVLQLYPETKALHIISHGSPGCLYLGNSQLSLDTLNRYAPQLQRWKLDNLLLYGCNVAAGDAGEEFIDKLHRLTGAGIAASQSRTGAAALGGDWKLGRKIAMGQETLALSAEVMTAYQGILAPLNAGDYAALKALYDSTNGDNWSNNTGWDFSSSTPPESSVVNGWHGVTVTGTRVTGLSLYDNQLSGSIPTELGDLSNLQLLSLSSNSLSGTIPTELGDLSNLEFLSLSRNQLSGSIPTELGDLSELQELYLYNNQLSGSIPTELGELSELQILSLYNNQLSGSIPTELGELSNLQILSLYNNQLSGSIPSELGNISELQELTLYNNQLSGSIPTELGDLSELQILSLNDNQLSGSIPTELGELSNLQTLYLYNNQLSGSIPTELGELSNLQRLSLRDNQLSGSIPTELGNLSELQYLYLYSNQLSGSIPDSVNSLSAIKFLENPPYVGTEIPDQTVIEGDPFNLNISGNFGDINGKISSYSATGLPEGLTISTSGVISGTPTSEGDYTVTVTVTDANGGTVDDEFEIQVSSPPLNADDYAALKALYDSTNGDNWSNNTGWDFSSSTPPESSVVNGWHGVTVTGVRVTGLSLSSNSLSGTIPTELGDLSELQTLSLYSNQLSGSIPTELGNLSNLERLDLYKNQLDGSIPTELGDLSNLQVLYLYNNQLSGSIPSELGDLSNLQRLSLRDNQLSGSIPSELGDLSNLQKLFLDDNQLSGSIPSELGDLRNLQLLYLRDNFLTGEIPDNIKNRNIDKSLENPPYVGTEIPDQTVIEGDLFNLDISGNFGDINKDISSYSATGLPEGLSISTSGVIDGTPTTENSYTVTVTVTDATNRTVDDEFEIQVSSPPLNADDYAALKALYDSTDGDNWSNNTGWDFSSSTPPKSSVVDSWYGVTVTGTRVTGLDLNDNQLSGSIPTELGDLSNLQVLSLSRNQLDGSIPTELGDLSNLQSLYLNDNQLTGEIPDSVENLPISTQNKSLENPPYVGTAIPDQAIIEGDLFNLDISGNFGDINGNISSYSATSLPEGLTISTGSGVIDGTPTSEGNYTVTVTARDATNRTVDDEFEITVSAPPITGTSENDILRGTASDEIIQGLVGNDRLYGNGGNDILEGGGGNDILYGQDGDDLLEGGLDNDRLYGDGGNDTLLGGDGNDILYGRAGDDLLEGGAGNDRLYGDAGNDTLDGGLGNDILYGNASSDIFVLAAGMGQDTIFNFEDGTDKIQLGGGLSFAGLDIVGSGSSTLIKILDTGETLATLRGIDSTLVDASDFV